MTILVTGAGGQVGSALARAAGDLQVVALDRTALDITDAAAVRAVVVQHQAKLVINAAAYTAVDRAEQEAGQAFSINRDGPAVLARVCAECGIPLFHLSTDYVFDGEKSTAYTEEDAISPVGVYARSKAEGEQAVRGALDRALILRVSWVFGVQGNNFVKTMIRLARQRDTLRVVADQHGNPTSAESIARALLLLARRYLNGDSMPWGTYHFSGSPSTTWYDFACRIMEVAHQRGLIARKPEMQRITTQEFPTPVKRPANSRLDCRKMEQVFGIAQDSWAAELDWQLQQLQQQGF